MSTEYCPNCKVRPVRNGNPFCKGCMADGSAIKPLEDTKGLPYTAEEIFGNHLVQDFLKKQIAGVRMKFETSLSEYDEKVREMKMFYDNDVIALKEFHKTQLDAYRKELDEMHAKVAVTLAADPPPADVVKILPPVETSEPKSPLSPLSLVRADNTGASLPNSPRLPLTSPREQQNPLDRDQEQAALVAQLKVKTAELERIQKKPRKTSKGFDMQASVERLHGGKRSIT